MSLIVFGALGYALRAHRHSNKTRRGIGKYAVSRNVK